MNTWGITLYGVELTPDDVKDEFRSYIEEADPQLIESDLYEKGIFFPPLMGLEVDAEARVFFGYFPAFSWQVLDNHKQLPWNKDEARYNIKEMLAHIVKDVHQFTEDKFSVINSYNAG